MKNRKGFTLIEMIVVLVIIAILAAFAIPAVFKYIDEAKNQKYVGEARMAYLAANTALTKAYAADEPLTSTDVNNPAIIESLELDDTVGYVFTDTSLASREFKKLYNIEGLTEGKYCFTLNKDADNNETYSVDELILTYKVADKEYAVHLPSGGAATVVEIESTTTTTP